MSTLASNFLFQGALAANTRLASDCIGTHADLGQLSQSLQTFRQGVSAYVSDNAASSDLNNLCESIDAFTGAVTRGDNEQAQALQKQVAQAIAQLPDHRWRLGTFPQLTASDRQLIFLQDVHQGLRAMTTTRAYMLRGTPEDREFVRTVLAGLSTFLDSPEPSETDIRGHAEEAAGILQDAGLIALAARTGVSLPPSPFGKSVALQARGTVVNQRSSQTRILDFEYHPLSEKPISALEPLLAKIEKKLEQDRTPWPYDFSRWARSLYFGAESVPNGRGKEIRRSISGGLRHLASLREITPESIRKLLGPAAMSLEKPLPGLPLDWPADLPMETAGGLIVLFDSAHRWSDAGLRELGDHLLNAWQAPLTRVTDFETETDDLDEALEELKQHRALEDNQEKIQREVAALVRLAQETIENGREIVLSEFIAGLEKINGFLPDPKKLKLSDAFQASIGEPPSAALQTKSPFLARRDWVASAYSFLAGEMRRHVVGEMAGETPRAVMARAINHLFRLLEVGNFKLDRAHELVEILFPLVTSFKRLKDFQTNAQDTAGLFEDWLGRMEGLRTTPHNAEALARHLESELTSDSVYRWLCDPTTLPDLVAMFEQYRTQGDPQAALKAAADFSAQFPKSKLSPAMALAVLNYVIDVVESPKNPALLRNLVGEQADKNTLLKLVVTDPAEAMFRDEDLEAKYTDYGRILMKCVWDHRPKVSNQPRFFMIFVHYLGRLYEIYDRVLKERNVGDFDIAFDELFAHKPEIGNDPRIRNQYRGLLQELLTLLHRQPELNEIVRSAISEGKTSVQKSQGKKGVRTAGGPVLEPATIPAPHSPIPPAAPSHDSLKDDAVTVRAPEVETPKASPAEIQAAIEAQFGVATVIAGSTSDNPFVDSDPDGDVLEPPPSSTKPVVLPPAVVVEEPEAPSPEPEAAPSREPVPASAPASTPPPSTEPISAPPAPVLPEAIDRIVGTWALSSEVIDAVAGMIATVGEETVARILENLTQRFRSLQDMKQVLENYASMEAKDRLSDDAKKSLLTAMSESPRLGQALLLLHFGAFDPLNLELDQVLPEQLIIRAPHARFMIVDNERSPNAQIRLATFSGTVSRVSENATTRATHSVFTSMHPNETIDIGVDSRGMIGNAGFVRAMLDSIPAYDSNQRYGNVLLLRAKGISDRALRFLLKHVPKATIAFEDTKTGNITLYTGSTSSDGIVSLQETAYAADGRRLSHQTRLLVEAISGELPVVTGNQASTASNNDEKTPLSPRAVPKDHHLESIKRLTETWTLDKHQLRGLKRMIEKAGTEATYKALLALVPKSGRTARAQRALDHFSLLIERGLLPDAAAKELVGALTHELRQAKAVAFLEMAAYAPAPGAYEAVAPAPLAIPPEHAREFDRLEDGTVVLKLAPPSFPMGLSEHAVTESGRSVLILPNILGEFDLSKHTDKEAIEIFIKARLAHRAGLRSGTLLVIPTEHITDRALRFLFAAVPGLTILQDQKSNGHFRSISGTPDRVIVIPHNAQGQALKAFDLRLKPSDDELVLVEESVAPPTDSAPEVIASTTAAASEPPTGVGIETAVEAAPQLPDADEITAAQGPETTAEATLEIEQPTEEVSAAPVQSTQEEPEPATPEQDPEPISEDKPTSEPPAPVSANTSEPPVVASAPADEIPWNNTIAKLIGRWTRLGGAKNIDDLHSVLKRNMRHTSQIVAVCEAIETFVTREQPSEVPRIAALVSEFRNQAKIPFASSATKILIKIAALASGESVSEEGAGKKKHNSDKPAPRSDAASASLADLLKRWESQPSSLPGRVVMSRAQALGEQKVPHLRDFVILQLARTSPAEFSATPETVGGAMKAIEEVFAALEGQIDTATSLDQLPHLDDVATDISSGLEDYLDEEVIETGEADETLDQQKGALLQRWEALENKLLERMEELESPAPTKASGPEDKREAAKPAASSAPAGPTSPAVTLINQLKELAGQLRGHEGNFETLTAADFNRISQNSNQRLQELIKTARDLEGSQKGPEIEALKAALKETAAALEQWKSLENQVPFLPAASARPEAPALTDESNETLEMATQLAFVEGRLSSERWLALLKSANLLSTPEGSVVILNETVASSIRAFLEPMQRSPERQIADDLGGPTVTLKLGGWGYRIAALAVAAPESWQAEAMEKLRTLGSRPSLILDVMAASYMARTTPEHQWAWRAIVGLVAASPSASPQDQAQLKSRLSHWASQNRERLGIIRGVKETFAKAVKT